MNSKTEFLLNRRRVLIAGGSFAAGVTTSDFPLVASAASGTSAVGESQLTSENPNVPAGGKLPFKQIEEILRTDGKVTDGAGT